MADTPQISVAVVADVNGLQRGMTQAEQTVRTSADRMATSVQKLDLGGRFEQHAQRMVKGLASATFALRELNAAQGDAVKMAESLGQAMMMSGAKSVAVVGGALSLGSAASEMIFKTNQKAREEAERLDKLDREGSIRSETRDLERQLEILKETDPVRRAELEGQRELALIRQKARQQDETDADRAKTRAEELLSIERTRQKVEEARKQSIKDAVTQPEGIIDTLTTSIGGAFRVAQRGAMALIQQKTADATQKTAENTQAMLDIMRRGEGVLA